MDYENALKEAERISTEECCVQHVNEIRENVYELSDWYDRDSTVVSFERDFKI